MSLVHNISIVDIHYQINQYLNQHIEYNLQKERFLDYLKEWFSKMTNLSSNLLPFWPSKM